MTQISPITSNVVFKTNLVSQRFVLHHRNLGFFRKLSIELNNIGKRAQSFFSKASYGLISNPYSLSNLGPEMPVYFIPPTQEQARTAAKLFAWERKEAIVSTQEQMGNVIELDINLYDDCINILTPEEEQRHEEMKADCDATFLAYGQSFELDTSDNTNCHQLEAGFKAHYSTKFFSDRSPIYGETYRNAMNDAEIRVSEKLLLNVARGFSGREFTSEDMYDQCIHSFREARKNAFYTTLRRNPELLSRLGSHISEAAAQYDTNFHTILMDKLGTGRKPNLQNLLMEAHQQSRFCPPGIPKYTPTLVEFNNRLRTYAMRPLLLSKMAVHAVRMIRKNVPSDPLVKALPTLSAVDREALATAMLMGSMPLEFMRRHLAAGQALSKHACTESPLVIHGRYMAAFRKSFVAEIQKYYLESEQRENPTPLKDIIDTVIMLANQDAISRLPKTLAHLSGEPLDEFLTAMDAA